MIAIWRAIYETKARCRHFRSCRNTGACSRAAQSGPPKIPKPTKADAQNVVQIITSDKAKTQTYCDLAKLFDQIRVAREKNDSNTVQALDKELLPLVDKIGPEYVKVIEGMEQVDLTSNEGVELLSILSQLDKRCTK